MKKISFRYILFLLLCVIILSVLAALNVFAADVMDITIDEENQIITIADNAKVTTDEIMQSDGYNSEYQVINYGMITGGIVELGNFIENLGYITGGTFVGDVDNVAESESVVGYIMGGTFKGNINNTGVNASVIPYITGGIFTGYIDNSGYITGGMFEESSEIYNHFLGLKNGIFKGTVTTSRYPINGGTYSGNVVVEHLGSISNGTFTETAVVTQESNWSNISGGTFDCEINNIAIVSNGTFNAKFTNSGMVSYATFNGDVINLEQGKIYSNDRAKLTMLNGNVINDGLIYSCEFGEKATVIGDGDTYVFVPIYWPTGILMSYVDSAFPIKYFKYGENVLDGFKRYNEEYGVNYKWTRFDGIFTPDKNYVLPSVDIEDDRTFQLQTIKNRFIRNPIKEIDHEHKWNAPIFSWSSDGVAATASFACYADGEYHVQHVPSQITSELIQEATCIKAGETTYTATAIFEDDLYTDTKILESTPALGHKYKYAGGGLENLEICLYYDCTVCSNRVSKPVSDIITMFKLYLNYYTKDIPDELGYLVDLNGDGIINVRDYSIIMQYLKNN